MLIRCFTWRLTSGRSLSTPEKSKGLHLQVARKLVEAPSVAVPVREKAPLAGAFRGWAREDSNLRPTDYESAALTS